MERESGDRRWLDAAARLATPALGTAGAGPTVGALVVDEPRQLLFGRGVTPPRGVTSAEHIALNEARGLTEGRTLYITLEPAARYTSFAPNTNTIVASGIGRVVIGVSDPNPPAAGGAQTLREAGVQVITGVREAEATRGNIMWLSSVRRQRPYLIWKFASTVDGRSAAEDGSSMWITSEASRMDVHALRGTVDAIIVGVGTVLADDSRLTARNLRDGSLAIRQPLRVVVDSHNKTPSTAKVRDGAAATWIATTEEVGDDGTGRVDLTKLMEQLYDRGVRSALLEGGPTLAGAFLAAGLVDKIVGYVAPKLLGGGPAALMSAGVTTITEAIELDVTDVDRVGPDLRITAVPKREN
jgi:diaminohydroxyphosphoribosylaminopyrimidine deaminase/5-amino-6-(5-phosphoribosylamino)uracil reductase